MAPLTLYRIDLKDPDVAFPRTIAWLIEMGVLVPVEPDAEQRAEDGTLLAVVIYTDAGRDFYAGVGEETP